jgi:hypothetical protein
VSGTFKRIAFGNFICRQVICWSGRLHCSPATLDTGCQDSDTSHLHLHPHLRGPVAAQLSVHALSLDWMEDEHNDLQLWGVALHTDCTFQSSQAVMIRSPKHFVCCEVIDLQTDAGISCSSLPARCRAPYPKSIRGHVASQSFVKSRVLAVCYCPFLIAI